MVDEYCIVEIANQIIYFAIVFSDHKNKFQSTKTTKIVYMYIITLYGYEV